MTRRSLLTRSTTLVIILALMTLFGWPWVINQALTACWKMGSPFSQGLVRHAVFLIYGHHRAINGCQKLDNASLLFNYRIFNSIINLTIWTPFCPYTYWLVNWMTLFIRASALCCVYRQQRMLWSTTRYPIASPDALLRSLIVAWASVITVALLPFHLNALLYKLPCQVFWFYTFLNIVIYYYTPFYNALTIEGTQINKLGMVQALSVYIT